MKYRKFLFANRAGCVLLGQGGRWLVAVPRVVAYLFGYRQGDVPQPLALVSNLVRQGVVDWGGGKPRGLADAPRVPGRRAEELVLEDRR